MSEVILVEEEQFQEITLSLSSPYLFNRLVVSISSSLFNRLIAPRNSSLFNRLIAPRNSNLFNRLIVSSDSSMVIPGFEQIHYNNDRIGRYLRQFKRIFFKSRIQILQMIPFHQKIKI
ncbi:hypothetical protein RCL_jg13934.t1 [Rhizophagus clarus]|uniref:Uncharacterized protein n=1 Tax=Rhizophagus clarus TaxID=94130 RepID=A0A8H3LT09_9GLOM|nr:hypothetical protein RCL_jg13934.t1 [Rhizophagus clarus]